MPHWCALRAHIIGGAEFSDLVAAFILLLLDEGFEFLILEIIFALLTLIVFLLLAILLGVHDVAHLVAVLVFEDLVTVHVVEDLTLTIHLVIFGLHLGGAGLLVSERWQICRIDDA